jgi:hypothetical protein
VLLIRPLDKTDGRYDHIWQTTWWNSAPVYKTDEELAALLEHVDFTHTPDKRLHYAMNLMRSGNRYSRTALACQPLDPLDTTRAYTGHFHGVTCVACRDWEMMRARKD